jgi:hypothetical protein
VPPWLDAAELDGIIGNAGIPELFAALARDLDTVEPKTPEDIYKEHLSGGSGKRGGGGLEDRGAAGADSAKGNLASTYVNAFVNAGYGQGGRRRGGRCGVVGSLSRGATISMYVPVQQSNRWRLVARRTSTTPRGCPSPASAHSQTS